GRTSETERHYLIEPYKRSLCPDGTAKHPGQWLSGVFCCISADGRLWQHFAKGKSLEPTLRIRLIHFKNLPVNFSLAVGW
ncbi:hypothetical protein, partial [Acidaminococcus sp. HCP3S3_G9_1]|uniref:hypothetical protein n=1 Tax=Acidaminococcus sp. HCP3S3_G9_1 TaxID=3438732 RepID=UPI003F923F5D